MNSVSALLGRFNELSSQLTTQQHENQGKHLGNHRGQLQDQNNGQNSVQVSLYEVSLSFSSSSFSSHEKGVKILEQELEVQFTGARSSQVTSSFAPAFQPPSVDDVANNVLGFVEDRIKQEADAGASPERLDDLLSQAREGVEIGFGQAREQIESLGLMTDELDNDVNQSFQKINTGIDGFVDTYVNGGAAESLVDANDEAEQALTSPSATSKDKGNEQVDDKQTTNDQVNAADRGVANRNSGINAGYSSFSSLSERAAIQITTQDGDVVSFNLEQIQASFERGELSSDRFGFESSQLVGQYQSGQYSYSVDGELDEGEIQALNDLMLQIEGMSEQFFSGDFQGAFQSALELGFDGQEIAGFSVNLSQTSVQQVSAYQQIADLGGAETGTVDFGGRFDPLADFFDRLQAAFDKANAFAEPVKLVSDLFDQMVNDRIEDAPVELAESTPLEQMQEYMSTLLGRL
ncbi:DUF5610 domain-containing protein [Alkalimarinus coralli]|uniref:DUF5610 domain-containing protein n=1 Tax=Alkalimarinus coralli TaxID=2935863 RepID=UPI00202AEBFD|nr:DUF5610 domain-containing protein [Alkalimarinus coralli]